LNRLTVFACESQPIVLEGLAKVLSSCDDLEYVGAATGLGGGLVATWLICTIDVRGAGAGGGVEMKAGIRA